MKKVEIKNVIIGIIIIVLIIIICYLLYIYKLDGRKCINCPYVEKLYTDNIIISSGNGDYLRTAPCFKNENAECYRAVLNIKTLSSDLKATGEITIKYDCDYQIWEWGNQLYYIDKKLTGKYIFDVEEMTSERVDFDVIRMDGSRINYIKCDFDIEDVKGNLYIYGERVQ